MFDFKTKLHASIDGCERRILWICGVLCYALSIFLPIAMILVIVIPLASLGISSGIRIAASMESASTPVLSAIALLLWVFKDAIVNMINSSLCALKTSIVQCVTGMEKKADAKAGKTDTGKL